MSAPHRCGTAASATRASQSPEYPFAPPNLIGVTGLIYVILIAIWAAVLVPRFLRHHDEMRRRREAERLEKALAPEAGPAVTDPDHRAGSWWEYVRSLTDVRAAPWVDQIRAPQGRHARRRRTIVLSLSATVGIGILGAVVGVLPGFLAAGSALLLGGYVTVMFTRMRRWESAGAPVADSRQYSAASHSQGEAPQARSTDGVRVVRQSAAEGSGSAWDPRQTTLPTYVNAPRASRIPRRLDLTGPGWTGAGMVEQAQIQKLSGDNYDREFAAVEPDEDEEVARYAYPEDQGDGYYRRAVNE